MVRYCPECRNKCNEVKGIWWCSRGDWHGIEAYTLDSGVKVEPVVVLEPVEEVDFSAEDYLNGNSSTVIKNLKEDGLIYSELVALLEVESNKESPRTRVIDAINGWLYVDE